MKKKRLLILIILLFIFSISTYAIYRVQGKPTLTLSTAKWNVKVKDKELKTAGTVDLNFTKDDIVWEPNPKVKEGTIAPGSKGTITFNVDATGTEVSTDVIVDIAKTNNNENIYLRAIEPFTYIGVNDSNKVKTITLEILWPPYNNYNQEDNNEINKVFDINVKVTVKQSFSKRISLKETILKDNGEVDAIKAKGTPDFSKIAATKEGMFMAEDDYGESYYYRGEADNWVSFAGYYWRIIRINGDGSIRLIYSGTKTNNTGNGAELGEAAYNTSYDQEKYADYKISVVKTTVDNWYKINILGKSFESKVADTGYCNDMSKKDTINFGAQDRLVTNKTPTLKCPNKDNDLLSKSNGKLTYPVGLITWDEVSFAGGIYYTESNSYNSNYYLYTGRQYWTMTPSQFWNRSSISIGRVGYNGGLMTYGALYYAWGVRPVLSLKSDVLMSSGDGTLSSPYVIS